MSPAPDLDPSSSSPRLVIVDYADVASDPSTKDLSSFLERAFGGMNNSPDSSSPLGIIAIRNIPNFFSSKNAFLPLAHALAHLPPAYLEEQLSDPTSFYNAGWSHGKEKLGDGPDFAKASYYFNPITDEPGSKEERERYPASYPCNKWPDEESIPRLKNFKDSGKTLGKIMQDAVALLARHVDALAEAKVEGYRKDLLYDAMKETEKVKGRLLYYFPLEENENNTDDNKSNASLKEQGGDAIHTACENKGKIGNWIGWHNDSGFLTSLAGDLYIDDATGNPLPPSQIDPEAGLYVTDRSGKSIHVQIPEDCMAVQIGECVQILTGGVVVATPHCVRGPRACWNNGSTTTESSSSPKVKVARISHPCFIDSKPNFPLTMPEGCSRDDVVGMGIGRDKVPVLEGRWVEDGMTFGDFLQKSFEKYYEWSS